MSKQNVLSYCQKNGRTLFVFLLGLALFLRLYFYLGASIEDDLGYVGLGYQLYSAGNVELGSDQNMRTMTYAPISLAYFAFGGLSPFATHFFHMVCGLMTMVIAYSLAKMFFGETAGLFSALLLSITPLHILYSSRIMPSLPETMWGGLAIWIFAISEEKRKRTGQGRHLVLALLVGILIGLAYLTRETGAVLLAAPIGYLFVETALRKRPIVNSFFQAILIALGFLAVFNVECFYSAKGNNDPFARWKLVRAAQQNLEPQLRQDLPPWNFYLNRMLNIREFGSPNTIVGSASWWDHIRPNFLDRYFTDLGLVGIVLVIGAVFYFISGMKSTPKIVAIWFLTYFLFLSFGSSSFTQFSPIRKFDRYLLLIITPASIMAGYLLSKLFARKSLRFPVSLALLGLISSSIWFTYHAHLRYHSFAPGIDAVTLLIRRHVDSRLPVYLPIWETAYLHYRENYRPAYNYRFLEDFDRSNTTGAYVVLTKEISGENGYFGLSDIPLDAPPRNWIKLGEIPLGDWDYVIPGRYPVLFYVPPIGENL